MSTATTNIESMLVEDRVFPPSAATTKAARISGMDAYNALCAEANKDFEGFWARQARENLSWKKPFTEVLNETGSLIITVRVMPSLGCRRMTSTFS